MSANKDIEALVGTLNAARRGDLTARMDVPEGEWADVARALNAFIEAQSRTASQLAAAAGTALEAAANVDRARAQVAAGVSRQQVGLAELARHCKSMEARSDEIGQIVEMLDDIASETNILALNAAMEASRAGAQGRGFGLVAEEVRKLAERASVATKEIEAFVQGVVTSSTEGTRVVEEVRSSSATVTSAAELAGRGVEQLGRAAREVSEVLSRLRFAGQDEAELARGLRERSAELSRLLAPLAGRLGDGRTPLSEALRRVLHAAAIGDEAND
jgi:methyl-accepting chemotaxis protein